MKKTALEINEFNFENKEWPDSTMSEMPKNPYTGDDPGYEYVQPKPYSEYEAGEESRTVMLYQLRDGERDTSLPVCFVDGRTGMLDEAKQASLDETAKVQQEADRKSALER